MSDKSKRTRLQLCGGDKRLCIGYIDSTGHVTQIGTFSNSNANVHKETEARISRQIRAISSHVWILRCLCSFLCVSCFIQKLLKCVFNRCLCSSAAGGASMAEEPLVTAGSNFPLDYRQEQDVTCSRRDSHGCFVNPWTTWQFPSYSTIARLFLTEKNNSNVPSAKEVNTHTHSSEM